MNPETPAATNASATPASNGSSAAPRDFENGDDEPPSSFTPRRSRRYDDPPILFPNVDVSCFLNTVSNPSA